MENWRPIPGYEGIYEASDLGNIRTPPGKTTSNAQYKKRVWKSRVLKTKSPKAKKRQDKRVTLWKDGERKDLLVARLVASAWHGAPADGMTVNHINGDWNDNRAENLEWLTLRENISAGYRDGLYARLQKPITLVDRSGKRHCFASMADGNRFLGRSNSYLYDAKRWKHTIRDVNGNVYQAIWGQ